MRDRPTLKEALLFVACGFLYAYVTVSIAIGAHP
jgi:hypothetical protein